MKQIYYFTIGLLLTFNITFSNCDSNPLTNGIGKVTVNSNSNINIYNSSSSGGSSIVPKKILKPTLTRAELKVSRSLNPDNVQSLNVRTNSGGVATIIVKKRDGKSSINNEPRQALYDVSNQFSRGAVRRGLFGPIQVLERLDEQQVKNAQQQQQQYSQNHYQNARVYGNWMNSAPVTLSQSQLYHRNPYEAYRFAPPSPNDQKNVNLINSFMKHVEQIESSRQLSTPASETAIRNDRDQVLTKIPDPVNISSDSVYVKDEKAKRSRSLMEIDTDGLPIINGIRVPDDENDKRQTWRNARVINGELVPYENGYIPPRTVEYGQLIYPVKKSNVETSSRKKSFGPFTAADNFSSESEDSNKSIGPFSVKDMSTSRSNQDSSLNGNIGPFSVDDMSYSRSSSAIDYIKRINDQERRKNYFAGRAQKELGGQQKIQRRMLTQPGDQYFPPSTRYTSTNTEGEMLVGPVLQYAHPEFGLQSAKVGAPAYEDQQSKSNGKKVEYYTNNAYNQKPNPQPMYQIEPASLNTREYYNYQQNAKPSSTYPYNYGFIRRVKPERPFWMKFGNQMRDTFQSGFAQVQEIARPVMDPLMEAKHKISHNLGFGGYTSPSQQAQEKTGVVSASPSSGSSMIFPALGMLAGGAALGLGAVTLGRFFDVSSLLMSRSIDGETDMQQQQRALEAINNKPTTTLYLVENNAQEENKRQRLPNKRRKRNRRSITAAVDDSLGSILQDIEQNIPKTGKIGFEQQIRDTDWSNTPCAKKVFCEVMINQDHDEIIIMEKKMFTLLGMMPQQLGKSLSNHLSEVTTAIQQSDCNRFICYQH
ncbi:unnamed protein product [Diamesa hyperborea]